MYEKCSITFHPSISYYKTRRSGSSTNVMYYEQVQLRPLLSWVVSLGWHDSGRTSPCTVGYSTSGSSSGPGSQRRLKQHREMPPLHVEETMKVVKVNWILEIPGGPLPGWKHKNEATIQVEIVTERERRPKQIHKEDQKEWEPSGTRIFSMIP